MRIVILGAGVQGTVFAVRLSIVGHQVTLVARPDRAAELLRAGATIQDVRTLLISTSLFPVLEKLPPGISHGYVPGDGAPRTDGSRPSRPGRSECNSAGRIHGKPRQPYRSSPDSSRSRTDRSCVPRGRRIPRRLLDSLSRYSSATHCVEDHAPGVSSLFREAGFPVDTVRDMDAWLQRHSVFITAIDRGSL